MPKIKKAYWITGILLLVSALMSVSFGAVFIPTKVVWQIILDNLPWVDIENNWAQSFDTIIWQVRLPHSLLVLLSGAALAGSGAAYQGLFRNPLADPYLIGVASGAGLGAVIAMALNWPQDIVGFLWIPLAAFIGAVLTVTLVYSLARVDQFVPLTTLILAGVAVGAFASAVTSFLILRSDAQIYRAVSYLFGGSPVSGWKPLVAVFPYMLIGLGAISVSGHILNLFQFGDDQAKQMGLPVERAKLFVIVTASLTAAAAVSFSGIIGFIGLIVPHIFRILIGSDYRRILPLSILGGATALLLADLLARILISPSTVPVGIVTALVGAPFFLWILRRAKVELFW